IRNEARPNDRVSQSKQHEGEEMTPVPALVGAVGGGRMGAGSAHAFALAGSNVAVIERDSPSGQLARGRVLAAIMTSVERKTTRETAEDLTARVGFGMDFAALAEAELVIEAVPESLEFKVDALGRAE